MVPTSAGSSGRTAARTSPRPSSPRCANSRSLSPRRRPTRRSSSATSSLLRDYVGRPSPLYRAERLAAAVGLGAVYLKREDLNHTGAHKINNTIGQCLLAERMGKQRVIAETGAGQHGVATATAAALLGLECAVFMGTEDIRRQSLNVYKMKLLGAQVVPVDDGTGTLADAVTAAMRHWVERVEDTFYVLGSALGPHPYPTIVREFQRFIGEEAIAQLEAKGIGRVDAVVACVGGGTNAIGTFYPFLHALRARDAAVAGRRRSRRQGHRHVVHGRVDRARATRRDARLLLLPAPRRTRKPARGLLDLGRSRLSRASVPSTRTCTTRGSCATCLSPTTRRSSPSSSSAVPRASSRPSSPRTRWPCFRSLPRNSVPMRVVLVTVSGRGDKDVDIVREAGLGE